MIRLSLLEQFKLYLSHSGWLRLRWEASILVIRRSAGQILRRTWRRINSGLLVFGIYLIDNAAGGNIADHVR